MESISRQIDRIIASPFYEGISILELTDSTSKRKIAKMNNDSNFSPRSAGRASRPAGRASAARKSSDAEGDTEGDTKKKFPWALHSLLEDAEKAGESDVVCWRPSGIAFKVHKRDEFMKRILPKYFKQTKFKSFVRQLNLWGFTFIDQGPDKGSYYHSKFVRGKQHLCHEMRRQKVKGSSVPAPKPYPLRPGLGLAAGIGDSPIGPYDLGNERIDIGSVFPREQSHRAFPAASQVQEPFAIGPSPLHRNSHEAFFHTNQSNSNLMFQSTQEQTIEPSASRGDWLDRLEAMFCPTDMQVSPSDQQAQGTMHPSWLEPRPIRTKGAGQKKEPPNYGDKFK